MDRGLHEVDMKMNRKEIEVMSVGMSQLRLIFT